MKIMTLVLALMFAIVTGCATQADEPTLFSDQALTEKGDTVTIPIDRAEESCALAAMGDAFIADDKEAGRFKPDCTTCAGGVICKSGSLTCTWGVTNNYILCGHSCLSLVTDACLSACVFLEW